jgi:hypothetical protein
MKYLVIDTNIWVRVVSQGKPGCEIAHLDDLRSLVEESKLTLLLPEVVQLELGKSWRSFNETVTIEIGKLCTAPLKLDHQKRFLSSYLLLVGSLIV